MRLCAADHHRTEHLMILVLAVGALAGSFVLKPSSGQGIELPIPGLRKCLHLPESCLSRTVFDLPCPGCGLTRSFVAMARGDLHGAFGFNLMGPVLFLLCWLQIPYRLAELFCVGFGSDRWQTVKERLNFVTWGVLGGLLLGWALRLLPWNAVP